MKPPLTLTVSVTQEHIDKGRTIDPFSCPVTLAVCDAMDIEQADYRVCSASLIRVWDSRGGGRFDSRYEVVTPQVARDFMRNFDLGTGGAKPITFTVMLKHMEY